MLLLQGGSRVVLAYSIITCGCLFLVSLLVASRRPVLAKMGAYECGFVSLGNMMIAFSCHFYVLVLLFVIFDLEVVLFSGLVFGSVETYLCGSFLAVVMISSFYLEWWLGSLSWRV